MVLGNKNGRPRVASNTQNIPPRASSSRILAHRLRSVEAARRRNLRHNVPTTLVVAPPMRRPRRKVSMRKADLPVPQVVHPVNDITKADPNKPRISLPRELTRPQFKPIDPKTITDIDEQLADLPLSILRMHLDVFSPEFTRSLSSVTILQRPSANTCLPSQLDVLVRDSTAIYPTHILAVTSARHTTGRRKVDLFPVHSLIMAAHCANMPTFPPSIPIPTSEKSPQVITLPVMIVAIPHPESFSALLIYLYSRDPVKMTRQLLPLPASPTLFEDPAQGEDYATRLVMTFTQPVILSLLARVHGLWQNAYACSIDDQTLWTVIDTLWGIMLLAMEMSTGQRPLGKILSPQQRPESIPSTTPTSD